MGWEHVRWEIRPRELQTPAGRCCSVAGGGAGRVVRFNCAIPFPRSAVWGLGMGISLRNRLLQSPKLSSVVTEVYWAGWMRYLRVGDSRSLAVYHKTVLPERYTPLSFPPCRSLSDIHAAWLAGTRTALWLDEEDVRIRPFPQDHVLRSPPASFFCWPLCRGKDAVRSRCQPRPEQMTAGEGAIPAGFVHTGSV